MKFLQKLGNYKKRLFSFILFFGIYCHADMRFYEGSSLSLLTESQVRDRIAEADALIFGEQHDSSTHHQQQVEILKWVAEIHGAYNLGMEFISYDQQDALDRFLNKTITEPEFLSEVNWQGIAFSEYRQQVLSPLAVNGWTYGINLPRWVAREISSLGLENITAKANALLPPNKELGTDTYFERFRETMKGHVPEASLLRYFQAQSMWDDTMAWKAAELIQNQQFLAIIVGEFHSAFGDGLPYRIQQRSQGVNLLNISQLSSCDEITHSKNLGTRADIILINMECKGIGPKH